MSRPTYTGPCQGLQDSPAVTGITASFSGGGSFTSSSGPGDSATFTWSGSGSLVFTQALAGQSVPQYPYYCQQPKCCGSGIQLTANATNIQAGTQSYSVSGENESGSFSSSSEYYTSLQVAINTISIVSATGNNFEGSDEITGLSVGSGLIAGMAVTGPGIPDNTTITGVSGTTVTLSNNTTAGATGGSYNFTYPNGGYAYTLTLTPGGGAVISDPDNIGTGMFDTFSGTETVSSGWSIVNSLIITSDPILSADLIGTHTGTVSFDTGSVTYSVIIS